MPLNNVWEWLTGSAGWSNTCAAGVPVPSDDSCADLHCDTICLTELPPGGRACVSCLQNPASPSACKLAAMGVLPGAEVRVVQQYPAYVFSLGHAEFAVDENMAKHVRVHPLNG